MDRGTWWTPVHGDIIEVIERVHTTGWFMQNHLFPTLLEAGKSQTKELTDSVPTENPVTSLQDEPQAGIKSQPLSFPPPGCLLFGWHLLFLVSLRLNLA